MSSFWFWYRLAKLLATRKKCAFGESLRGVRLGFAGSSSIQVKDEQTGTVHLVGPHFISFASFVDIQTPLLALFIALVFTLTVNWAVNVDKFAYNVNMISLRKCIQITDIATRKKSGENPCKYYTNQNFCTKWVQFVIVWTDYLDLSIK